MVITELKFETLMERLDELNDEIQEMGGELNSMDDGEEPTDELLYSILEDDIDKNYDKILEIAEVLSIDVNVLFSMFDSCVTNRWQVYANLMGRETTTLQKMFN